MMRGLVGYCGLDTLIRADFLRPVHIVRQTIPKPDTQISAYHTNIGLSIGPVWARVSRRITIIPGSITNQVSGYARYAGNNGLVVC